MIDCKVPECKVIAANAPKLIDHLCDDCKAHFEGLKERLDNIGIEYSIDPNIVRGLDYYTRTVFEFVSENVGSQGTICGGGRYDGLVESMGGTAVPGIGFAMGVERFMLEANSQGVDFGKTDYVKVYLANLAYELRLKGVGCEVDLCQRSFRAQMKYAGKAGIPYVVVIGDDELDKGEVSIKRMSDGTSNTVALSNFVEYCMNEL
jgi:histidyl-tRNA synthetase